MGNHFNEATRVQMPAMVHLTRLGYKYAGKISEIDAGVVYDPDTNILLNVFRKQFEKLNPERKGDCEQVLKDIRHELDNDDLGRSFYKRLISVSPVRLIDFENIDNNEFHFTAEFTCKRDEDNFRPDITLFVNGLPLVFVEVKKPNNKGGMIAESNRMNEIRFPNKKFRRFLNITQFMIFSNNMEYDTLGGIVPVEGAFYCTTSKSKAFFNVFREENPRGETVAPYNKNYPYQPVDSEIERKILSDFNNQVIHTAPEYRTNLDENTPTNRILTSMCSPERLLFILKYGIAYVKSEREINGKLESRDEKQIMRYQQLFASLAIRKKIGEGLTSGVVWHTQGSGKTALSYYLNFVLTDYFAEQNKVAKFYFIVDRIDLLEQAASEFKARGLSVKTANTKEELMAQFRMNQSLDGDTGQNEITVVNIQRFAEDKEKINLNQYATNLQRVFIIDEAHRGYKPEGSFLVHLFEADPNSIKIALTGTPLLKAERASWKVFGNYYHTYYYDKSIEDGYTLKIIREPVETSYKEKLSEIYEKMEKLIQKKDIKRSIVVEHDRYVKELLKYIITDFKRFRKVQGDDSLGGMVVCETSEQARKMHQYFDEVQSQVLSESDDKTVLKDALILHDSDDKETRKMLVQKEFKCNGTIDILFVYNMLLTGFDAPRLKRLYLGRKLHDHTLLQAITRVNRPYKDHKYGFVVDFADIKKNFDETNEAYMKELNRFNDPLEIGPGVEPNTFNQIIENKEKLIKQMQDVKELLFEFSTDNAEVFSQEVSTIEDKVELIKLKNALVSARDCSNLVRAFGDDDLKDKFQKMKIENLPSLISEVQHCIDSINLKEALAEGDATKILINQAMYDITFKFDKLSEEELRIIGGTEELEQKRRRVIDGLIENENDDPEDVDYLTIKDALVAFFKSNHFEINTIDEFENESKEMDEILKKLAELHRKNEALKRKYRGDVKFARLHKRIKEENIKRSRPMISPYDDDIMKALLAMKDMIDKKVYDREDILRRDTYFNTTIMNEISNSLDALGFANEREDRLFIQSRLSQQYMAQYRATYGA